MTTFPNYPDHSHIAELDSNQEYSVEKLQTLLEIIDKMVPSGKDVNQSFAAFKAKLQSN